MKSPLRQELEKRVNAAKTVRVQQSGVERQAQVSLVIDGGAAAPIVDPDGKLVGGALFVQLVLWLRSPVLRFDGESVTPYASGYFADFVLR